MGGEPAPRIVFLELHEQEILLEGLSSHPQLRAMVAMLIFAGLRRAETLWLAEKDGCAGSRHIAGEAEAYKTLVEQFVVQRKNEETARCWPPQAAAETRERDGQGGGHTASLGAFLGRVSATSLGMSC